MPEKTLAALPQQQEHGDEVWYCAVCGLSVDPLYDCYEVCDDFVVHIDCFEDWEGPT